MSAAPATAALPNNPDPPLGPPVEQAADGVVTQSRGDAPIQSRGNAPAQSRGGAPAQSHTCLVLSLLRKLIDYGQELARTVQQRAAAGTLLTIALQFGTRDMALILARITRGLRLANALETRLVSRPVRADADPAPVRMPAERDGPRARQAAPRATLPDVPTAEEITAALRGRPAAAVIADICRDLGIVPAHPLWNEVMLVLAGHGGGFAKFFKDVMDRVCAWLAAPSAANTDPWPAPGSHPAMVCATGPP